MKHFHLPVFSFSLALTFTLIVNVSAAEMKSVDDFRAAAAKANAVLTVPDWDQTPKAVEASMKEAIAKANKALDQIGAQDLGKVTFKSTVVALDDLAYRAGIAANKAAIIKETKSESIIGRTFTRRSKLSQTHIRNSPAKTKSCSTKHCAIIAALAWICRPISAKKSSSSARSYPS